MVGHLIVRFLSILSFHYIYYLVQEVSFFCCCCCKGKEVRLQEIRGGFV